MKKCDAIEECIPEFKLQKKIIIQNNSYRCFGSSIAAAFVRVKSTTEGKENTEDI